MSWICPMQQAERRDEGHGEYRDYASCSEEQCNWWFGAQECCSIVAIANSLHKQESTQQGEEKQ